MLLREEKQKQQREGERIERSWKKRTTNDVLGLLEADQKELKVITDEDEAEELRSERGYTAEQTECTGIECVSVCRFVSVRSMNDEGLLY